MARNRIPLVIGVTGHRRLRPEDLPRLKSAVEVQLRSIIASYPNTKLILLSPLAGGADQLVAEVALQLKGEKADIDLMVPLPMPVDPFLATMDGPAEREGFQRLYAQAAKKFVVDHNPSANLQDPEVRRVAFLRGGIYLAIHSQILFALWDGKTNREGAGTDAIADFRLRGPMSSQGAEEFRSGPLDSNEAGPLYHIWTPRRDGDPAELKGALGSCQIKYSEEFGTRYDDAKADPKADPQKQRDAERQAKKFFDQVFRNIDQFNKNVKTLAGADQGPNTKEADASDSSPSPQDVFDGLLTPEQRQLVGPQALNQVDRVAAWHQAAVRLADAYQKTTYTTFFTLMGLGTLAALCAQFRGFADSRILAWGYVVALTLAMAVFVVMIWIRKVHAKRLDYRALAESLRIFFYWRLAGVPDNVAKYYLSSQRSELDWIRYAMRTLQMTTRFHAGGELGQTTPERIQAVRAAWIQGQGNWMEAKRREFLWKLRMLNLASAVFFVLAIVQGLLLCQDPHDNALTICLGLSMIGFGLCHLYAEVRGYSHRITEYGRMKPLLDKGDRNLPNLAAPTAKELKTAQEIIRDLGREALIENADWLLYHRTRVVKPVP